MGGYPDVGVLAAHMWLDGGRQTLSHQSLHNTCRLRRVFQMSPATQQMQPTQTLQTPPPSGGRRRRVVDEDPDERRRKFLERNRAAATRCRQKRKVWVMSLEKKAEELTQTNMQLQVQTPTWGSALDQNSILRLCWWFFFKKGPFLYFRMKWQCWRVRWPNSSSFCSHIRTAPSQLCRKSPKVTSVSSSNKNTP